MITPRTLLGRRGDADNPDDLADFQDHDDIFFLPETERKEFVVVIFTLLKRIG